MGTATEHFRGTSAGHVTRKVLWVSLIILFSSVRAATAQWGITEIMGKPAPPFSLTDLSDAEETLSSYKEKVVLINFWATWCIPCRIEMPSLNRLYQKYEERGFVVLGISNDRSRKMAENFLSKTPVDFPVLLDSNLRVAREYRVFAYPTTLLVDREGILREKFLGERDWMNPELSRIVENYIRN